MPGDKAKWAYTFALVGVAVWWFNCYGAENIFGGALISLLTLTAQYWFRKKPTEVADGQVDTKSDKASRSTDKEG